jgi:hypothetical protein
MDYRDADEIAAAKDDLLDFVPTPFEEEVEVELDDDDDEDDVKEVVDPNRPLTPRKAKPTRKMLSGMLTPEDKKRNGKGKFAKPQHSSAFDNDSDAEDDDFAASLSERQQAAMDDLDKEGQFGKQRKSSNRGQTLKIWDANVAAIKIFNSLQEAHFMNIPLLGNTGKTITTYRDSLPSKAIKTFTQVIDNVKSLGQTKMDRVYRYCCGDIDSLQLDDRAQTPKLSASPPEPVVPTTLPPTTSPSTTSPTANLNLDGSLVAAKPKPAPPKYTTADFKDPLKLSAFNEMNWGQLRVALAASHDEAATTTMIDYRDRIPDKKIRSFREFSALISGYGDCKCKRLGELCVAPLPELAEGWFMAYTKGDSHPYYWHAESRATTWDKPKLIKDLGTTPASPQNVSRPGGMLRSPAQQPPQPASPAQAQPTLADSAAPVGGGYTPIAPVSPASLSEADAPPPLGPLAELFNPIPVKAVPVATNQTADHLASADTSVANSAAASRTGASAADEPADASPPPAARVGITTVIKLDRSHGKKLGIGFKDNKGIGKKGVYISMVDPAGQAFGQVTVKQKVSILNGQDVREWTKESIRPLIESNETVTLEFDVLA